jgi:ABC-type bacteriocin/lantibiotic exporter with double-glycine peptidase domain
MFTNQFLAMLQVIIKLSNSFNDISVLQVIVMVFSLAVPMVSQKIVAGILGSAKVLVLWIMPHPLNAYSD